MYEYEIENLTSRSSIDFIEKNEINKPKNQKIESDRDRKVKQNASFQLNYNDLHDRFQKIMENIKDNQHLLDQQLIEISKNKKLISSFDDEIKKLKQFSESIKKVNYYLKIENKSEVTSSIIIDDLNKEIESKISEIESANKEVQLTKNEVSRYKKEITNLKNQFKNYNFKIKHDIKGLQEALAKHQLVIRNKEIEIKKIEQEKSKQSEKYESLKNQIVLEKNKESLNQDRISKLESLLESQASKFNSYLKELKFKFKCHIDKINEEKDSLIKQKDVQIKGLEEKIIQTSAKWVENSIPNEELTIKISQYEVQIEELIQDKNELNKLSKLWFNKSNESINELNVQKVEYKKLENKYLDNLSLHDENIKKINDLSSEILTLNSYIENVAQERMNYEKSINSYKNKCNELEDKLEELNLSKHKLSLRVQEIEEALEVEKQKNISALNIHKSEQDALLNEINSLKTYKENIVQERMHYEKSINSYKNKCNELEDKLEELKLTKNKLSSRVQEIEDAFGAEKQKNTSASTIHKSEQDALLNEINSLKTCLEQSKTREIQLINTVNVLESSSEGKGRQLQIELQNAIQKNILLDQQKYEIYQQNKNTELEMNKVKSDLNQKINDLSFEIADLTEKNELLSSKYAEQNDRLIMINSKFKEQESLYKEKLSTLLEQNEKSKLQVNDVKNDAKEQVKKMNVIISKLKHRETHLNYFSQSMDKEKDHFKRSVSDFIEEVKMNNSLSPLKTYLQITEKEISKIEIDLGKIPALSIERPKFEDILEGLIRQRESLKIMIEESDQKIQHKLKKLYTILQAEALLPLPPLPPSFDESLE